MAALTKSSYDALANELEELKVVKRAEIAERIKEARGYGDLSENSEYDEAKNEQAKVEARIADLEFILENSEVIDPSKIKTDKISVGCKVTLYDKTYDEENTYYIVGSAEADPINNKLSDKSPLGKELIGKKNGDLVTVSTPNGGSVDYEIRKIEKSE